MRKKIFIFSLILITVFFLTNCGKKSKSINTDSLLSLVPSNVNGVLVFNSLKARNIDYLKNMMNPKAFDIFKGDKKGEEKYKEFLAETGIDFSRDVNYVVVGIGDKTGVILVNVKYDKTKLLNYLKKKKAKLDKIDYKNKDFYLMEDKNNGNKKVAIVFFDNNIISTGEENLVKSVIDLYDGGKESILKNGEINKLTKQVNRDGIMWGVFKINPNIIPKQGKMIPLDTKKITAVIANLDYVNNTLEGSIKVLSGDSKNNKKVAEMLNGLKAGFSMGKNKFAKIFEHLNFVSDADSITLNISLPQALLDQLKKEAEAKAKGLLNQKPDSNKKDI